MWLFKLRKWWKRYSCKHDWNHIHVTEHQFEESAHVLVEAFSTCKKCNNLRSYSFILSHMTMRTTPKPLIENFKWVVAGILAREIYGRKVPLKKLGVKGE